MQMHLDEFYLLLIEKKSIPAMIFCLKGKVCHLNLAPELIEKLLFS